MAGENVPLPFFYMIILNEMKLQTNKSIWTKVREGGISFCFTTLKGGANGFINGFIS
jgi:hypothetical protein